MLCGGGWEFRPYRRWAIGSKTSVPLYLVGLFGVSFLVVSTCFFRCWTFDSRWRVCLLMAVGVDLCVGSGC